MCQYYIYLIKGEYDTVLKWPFVGNITIKLLNHLEDKNHFIKILDFNPEHNKRADGNGLGYPKYIPHSKLSHDSASNTQYLEEDTLYFKISIVKIASQKPWLQYSVQSEKTGKGSYRHILDIVFNLNEIIV